ncbi:SseB protein N-terminal domain-containing protein [Streptomyces zhaozhouensis]|uniref:SseB protein N-terminal domain-containing protein n=1 Tax=Streptomyces zhaozhouensis TaxID=1300267 RepID=A0A286DS20_9ACTN|nr:SseB family protein [Streptomyces zhaozhouensis]SOD61450.1 SseB protein N-terminal domain-containing protein [Streptomyces zhaozhouensis]
MALKNIPRPAFADDDGTADPALRAALDAWAADPAPGAEAVVGALARARLLAGVVAVLGEEETDEAGRRREKSSEMALLTLELPGGRRALPVFTALETLARWQPEARPVPVTASQALAAAVQEGAGALVLDVAGPVTFEVVGPALRALAGGGPPAEHPEVLAAVREVLAAQPAVAAARLVAGGEADGTLAVLLDAEADPAAVARPLVAALAAHPTLRLHLVRGLSLAVLPPGTALPGEPDYRR